MDLTQLVDFGVESDDHIDSLLSRGYKFKALEVFHESETCSPGVALVPVDDLHSIDSLIRQDSITKFELDIGWTQYQSMNTIVIKGPLVLQHALVFAQSIAPILKAHPFLELSVLLPLCPTPLIGETRQEEDDTLATWQIWDVIRTICDYSARLHVALQVPSLLPSEATLARWLSEDVRQIFISASIFLVNNKGYPVLPKAHQTYVLSACKFGPSIVLQDIDRHQRLGGDDAYLDYLRHLLKSGLEVSMAEMIAPGYQDFLQQPLQPLKDNLSSATYETFERDPVKYAQYEKAIYQALLDRPRGLQTSIAVVGAGRGPLVDCCLRAAEALGLTILLFVVEKNPHAVAGLRQRLAKEWSNKVILIESDMRHWHPDEYIDILVSELLGSFGDNELSPECLDGVQHVLNPASGVSIPSRYTPFVAPLMTPKLYQTLKSNTADARETPYVVLLSQCSLLAPNFEPLWHFHHPSDQSGSIEERQLRNKRYGRAVFQCDTKGVCHGVAGYFESILYGDIELSTVPDTMDIKSPDMVSWFPIFFPILKPLIVPGGASIETHFWRESDGKRVWYEYVVEVHLEGVKIATSDLINQGGNRNSIQL